MFAFEEFGYKKDEVDAYIVKLKSELMEKKLSLLNSEQKVLDLTQKKNEIDQKEKNILKAVKVLEEAHKIQEEGSRKLTTLKSKQNSLICEKVEDLLNYLQSRHPELSSEKKLNTMISELEDIVDNARTNEEYPSVSSENDSMRMLLNKMQEYRKQKDDIKTVKIERNNLKHVFDDSESVDDFLSSKPENDKLYENISIESSGFDLKEAVNPKDDLDEIMKAFDFFNNND